MRACLSACSISIFTSTQCSLLWMLISALMLITLLRVHTTWISSHSLQKVLIKSVLAAVCRLLILIIRTQLWTNWKLWWITLRDIYAPGRLSPGVVVAQSGTLDWKDNWTILIYVVKSIHLSIFIYTTNWDVTIQLLNVYV